MKYLGEKSISSALALALRLAWHALLIGSVLGLLVASVVLFSDKISDRFLGSFLAEFRKELELSVSGREMADWENFVVKSLPLRALVLPYFAALSALLLMILSRTRLVFENFTKNIVFDTRNAALLSKISKLNIVYSLLVLNLASLLISILLFILCEVFEKGAGLQEDHDLTI